MCCNDHKKRLLTRVVCVEMALLVLNVVDDVKMGSIDDGDPNTTNIYLGNLPTKVIS